MLEEVLHSNAIIHYLLAGARASSANLSSGRRSLSLQNYFKAPEIQERASRGLLLRAPRGGGQCSMDMTFLKSFL